MRRSLALFLGAAVLVGTGATTAVAAPTRGDGGELGYQETIDLAFEDIQAFWSEALPGLYGIDYRVLRPDQFIAYDENTRRRDLPGCGEEVESYDDIAQNAFYCPLGADTGDDLVAYDDGGLFPSLWEQFGPFALVQVLAHEWGHAIQGQTRTLDVFVESPDIQTELQADCFTGAYIGWVHEGRSEIFELEAGDIETGIAGMLEIRDPVGTDPTEEGAHGSGFDRVNAFAEGLEQGGARCVEYDDIELLPAITEIPFSDEEDLEREGNLPFGEAIEFGIEDLDLYWAAVFDANGIEYAGVGDVVAYKPRRAGTLPECEALGLTPERPRDYRGQVFYCPGEDFIAFDQRMLKAVHGQIGDFGTLVQISGAWAAAMQEQLGLTGASLQADCFSGAWAGSIPLDLDGDGEPDLSARNTEVVRDAAIILSPGDLDEVVIAFVVLTTDDAELTLFDRLGAFRGGFYSPTAEEDCSAVTG